ncbi:hypothetical protein ACVWY3_000343 [Bradyrhizobium sp. USDA 4486]
MVRRKPIDAVDGHLARGDVLLHHVTRLRQKDGGRG